MASDRGRKVLYWVLLLLVVLPTAGSGILEAFYHGPAQTVESLQRLGYPLYLMKILGIAKIAGGVVLLADKPLRLVEWAYAGFTILFVGATASHLLAGNAVHAPVPAFFLLPLFGAYLLRSGARVRTV